VLITNPDHDDEFRAVAHAALDAGASSPAALQAALRDRYPQAVVHPRELSTEPRTVWYVYREGHWIR
jgi:hypothetical protein